MSDFKHRIQEQGKENNYWRSFEELSSDPAFLAERDNEFKEGVDRAPDVSGMSGLSRRKFLALMGASAALAGTACSDYRDKGEIVPYKNKPEEITVGKPNYYASTCRGCEAACGILIKTREGRPIKVDGNPDHPVSKGKICAQGQASIVGLYDPDRIKSPKRNDGNTLVDIDWKVADEEVVLALSTAGEREIAIITDKIVSPTENSVLNRFIEEYPSTKIYSYEQFNSTVRNSAWKKCYGSQEFPVIKWNKAEVIVSLDADFLGTDSNRIENSWLFSEGRDIMNKRFNRLYSVESTLSLTGMNADYRLKLRPDAQYAFVMAIINELQNRNAISSSLDTSKFNLSNFADEFSLLKDTLANLVNDLANNKGKAIIYAGDHLPENVHIVVNLLNEELGNSKLYDASHSKESVRSLSGIEDLKELVYKMNSGDVGVIIHYGSNPVYNFPVDLRYSSSLQYVDEVITMTEIGNESSQLSNLVLPVHHTFESWGDVKTRTGLYSLQQPVIAPLYNTRQRESILLTWISGDGSSYKETVYHEYLIANWESKIYPTLNSNLKFKQLWYGALHDGVVKSSDKSKGIGSFNFTVFSGLVYDNSVSDGIALHIKQSYSLKDGRFANNGWLQELPHPVSKVTWDNYAAISPATAKKIGLQNNELIEITIEDYSLSIPVFVQPGNADNSITIEAGYGRKNAGTISENVGFNVNEIVSSTAGITPWLFTGVEVKKVSGSYNLVVAQTIYNFSADNKRDLPEKRGIIKEGAVQEYLNNPQYLHEETKEEMHSVNPPIDYDGLKWGMSIDLNKCVGCNDCTVACNVENNIPVVGKEQVEKGREMHWLRVDRYYSGTPEDPKVSKQPMLCQHCDQAPCENVCPVIATSHSPDGLNQMVYNRCVGTRYCSNNCPYKVRRFNFFNFRNSFNDAYQEAPVFALLQNPEVTVRSRGVMEKCTFCVQRIAEARSDAIKEGRDIKGSDVTTACQEACSTNAIKFGDINDTESEFYKYRNHELGYYVLEELNIKPNVTYIAKLKNTHSEDA